MACPVRKVQVAGGSALGARYEPSTTLDILYNKPSSTPYFIVNSLCNFGNGPVLLRDGYVASIFHTQHVLDMIARRSCNITLNHVILPKTSVGIHILYRQIMGRLNKMLNKGWIVGNSWITTDRTCVKCRKHYKDKGCLYKENDTLLVFCLHCETYFVVIPGKSSSNLTVGMTISKEESVKDLFPALQHVPYVSSTMLKKYN